MSYKKSSQIISEVLYRLNVQAQIDNLLLEEAFDTILSDRNLPAREIQLSAILTGLMARGPKKEEIVTLLKSVFKLDNFDPRKRRIIRLPKGKMLVGAIGSGKKGIKTMNISTPALLTVASLGAYTAKSVSHGTSSLSGSADFLEQVGCNLEIPRKKMEDIVLKVGFGAFEIENLLPKFNVLYGQKFIAPHALSFGLAALASPIQYDNFLYGLAHPNVELSLDVLRAFGVKNAMVISTTHDKIHYIDEMGVYGKTKLIGVKNGKVGPLKVFNPVRELDLPKYLPKDISQGRDIKENIKFALDVLKGTGERAREDAIAINSATILHLTGITNGLREGYKESKKALRQGLPYKKLMEFISATGGDLNNLKRFK